MGGRGKRTGVGAGDVAAALTNDVEVLARDEDLVGKRAQEDGRTARAQAVALLPVAAAHSRCDIL